MQCKTAAALISFLQEQSIKSCVGVASQSGTRPFLNAKKILVKSGLVGFGHPHNLVSGQQKDLKKRPVTVLRQGQGTVVVSTFP